MKVSFSSVDLVVSNVLKSVEFYRQLGIDIPENAIWGDGKEVHHVEVSGGDSSAGLALDSETMTKGYDAAWPGGTGSVMIFSVSTRDDVDAKYAELTGAGFESHMPPADVFWGSRYAIVDDPDGNHVGIMSPQDKAHEDAPSL